MGLNHEAVAWIVMAEQIRGYWWRCGLAVYADTVGSIRIRIAEESIYDLVSRILVWIVCDC